MWDGSSFSCASVFNAFFKFENMMGVHVPVGTYSTLLYVYVYDHFFELVLFVRSAPAHPARHPLVFLFSNDIERRRRG